MDGYSLEALLAEKTALVVVDMQNDFVHSEGAFAKAGYSVRQYQALVPGIESLRKAARAAGIPVWSVGMSHNEANDGNDAWIQRRRATGHPDSCRTGTWGQEFYPGMEPGPEDRVLWKHRFSAFAGTDFHDRLQAEGVRTLVFTGINTNTCVESCARDAYFLGYHVIVVRDCTACAFEDAYEPSLRNIDRHIGLTALATDVASMWKET